MAVNKKQRDITLRSYDQALIHYLNNERDQLSPELQAIFAEVMPYFDNNRVTLRSLCEYLGIEVPQKFASIADDQQKIAFRSKRVKPGNISLVIRSSEDFGTTEMKTQYQDSLKNGAKLVIMSQEEFATLGLDAENEPVILMDHSNERIFRMFSLIRQQNKAKVVMLTGSVGKTTTKDLCYTVAQGKFRTYANENNTNTPHQIADHLFYNSDRENEVFIHEAGAGYFGSVRFSASMLQPDVLVLTNVYGHHLQVYQTIENILADKVSGDDYLSKDGVVVTNFDDERIRNHPFKHKVMSFGIQNPDVDFRAINIQQVQDKLTFDILEKATGKTTPVKVKILGEHNVYNILAAFVLGKTLGMTEAEIQDSLLEYAAGGVRQNLTNVGGVYLLLDCYNVAEESIAAMLSAGEQFQLDGQGKRHALLGGENKLGKDVVSRSKDFGTQIAKYNIDHILFCGTPDRSSKALNHFGDGQAMMEGFQKVSDKPVQIAYDIEQMYQYLSNNVKRDDLVMVKGIYYLQMPIAVDRCFGSSFSFDLSHNKAAMKPVSGNGFKSNLIEEFGELELSSVPVVDNAIEIPDAIKNYPVFRIKKNAVSRKQDVTSIRFGNSLKNIGAESFRDCTQLEVLEIPGNVKVIENQAFQNCTSLKRVVIAEGVTHIGQKAFAGCSALEEIHIPASVGMIEEKVFSGCPNVKVICQDGTYASRYMAAPAAKAEPKTEPKAEPVQAPAQETQEKGVFAKLRKLFSKN